MRVLVSGEQLRYGLVIAAVVAMTLCLAEASVAHDYSKPITTHNLSYVRTVGDAPVKLRDIHGNVLLNTQGQEITATPKPHSSCPGTNIPCLRIQGYESIDSSSGKTLFYNWEWNSADGDRPGFIWLADLQSRPSVDIAFAGGNGVDADPTNTQNPPIYRVTAREINWFQGYVGAYTGLSYQYSPWGIPGGGMTATLLTWNFADVRGGGIARAVIADGEIFYPATNVLPIEMPSYLYGGETVPLGAMNGSVTARYGFVRDGTREIWGWLATKHTYQGGCVEHVDWIGGGSAVPGMQCAENTFFGDQATDFRDVHGDGKADLVAASSGAGAGVNIRTSTGSTFSAGTLWTEGEYFGDAGTKFADVTGDGKTDAIVLNTGIGGKITVRRSDGSKFLPNESWTSNVFVGNIGTYFADVTGDGKADAIANNSYGGGAGVTVRRSTGSGFGPNETWISGAYYGNAGTMFADVTGDGRADAVVVNTMGGGAGVTVRRSNGTSFTANENWSNGVFAGSAGTYFADVTGDGKADAIANNVGGYSPGTTIRRSTGSSFAANETWISGNYTGSVGNFFADVTGDGRADSIVINSGGGAAGVTVRRSTGSSFAPNETWLTP